jgi:putative zinc finger/helix-turn-helix YgiT family protein
MTMARPFPWKCRECGKPEVRPVIVDYSTELEHDGRLYSVTIKDAQVLKCQACGSEILPHETHERLLEALRKSAGLLMPSEITEERESLGLTQKTFAEMLGVAPATVSRWESGAQIQQRVMNDWIKAFFALPTLRRYLWWQRFPEGRLDAPPEEHPTAVTERPSKVTDETGKDIPFFESRSRRIATNDAGRLVPVE